jgi:hypothetical protein
VPLKTLSKLDSQILKLREEIAASQVPPEKFAELDKLIAQRIELINSLSGPQRIEGENRPSFNQPG